MKKKTTGWESLGMEDVCPKWVLILGSREAGENNNDFKGGAIDV
jgi:hypothetical protein